MLKSLYIKNYAIIDELNIDFNDGFNVFTGETGAGKSIIVGALSYLIKGKADTSIIKSGQDKAIIEGIFDIEDSMKNKLNEADIEYDDELIVRRTISNDGHNTIKINQCSVTLAYLSDLFDDIIDIHSQKDSQYLLNKKNHIILLDKYCHDDDLLNNYNNFYTKYKTLEKEYNELINNTYNESELEYLKFDLDELEKADLNEQEEIELIEKEKRFKQSEKYITTLQNCLSLYEDDRGIKDNLGTLLKELNLDDESIINTKQNIENIYYSLDDEISKLKDVLDEFNGDDFDIERIEERLFIYSKLKRKHNKDTKGLLDYKETIFNKIKFFEDKDFVLNEKKKELDIAYNNALEVAKSISNVRKQKAIELEKEIVSQTEDLMLKNVQFKVNFNETDLSNKGIDDIEFYISLNEGSELKPLKNVASGGEISRLMLSLKTVFSKLSNCALIIFDEIDTGVSGKVGLAIGEKMASISKSCQVLSITHLASVAACADYHYYIYKDGATKIKQLNEDEIISEIANISSADINDNSLIAARDLYNTAQKLVHEN